MYDQAAAQRRYRERKLAGPDADALRAADKAKAAKWKQKNRAKHLAHRKIENAVHRGTLVKPTVCSTCQEERPLDAHHDDYAKPFDVRWLCRRCHKKEKH